MRGFSGRAASSIGWIACALAPVNAALYASFDSDGLTPGLVAFYVAMFSYAAVGAVVLRRYPQHRLGWLFIFESLLLGITGPATAYAENFDPSATGYLAASVFASVSWILGIALVVCFLGLLLPDGNLPSRRWRPVAWAGALVVAFAVLGTVLAEGPLSTGTGQNPLGVPHADALANVAPVILLAVLAMNLAAVVVRYRRGTIVERQQLKWIGAGFVVVIAGGFTQGQAEVLQFVSWSLLPLAFAVAILRYRLYEIDVIIRKTLVYAGVVAVLAALYLGGIYLIGETLRGLTGGSSTLAVTVSTLAVAVAFQPLRSRIQRVVDHRFYRRKYDAAHTLEIFSGRLRQQIDLDALDAEVLGVVRDALQPSHASLWLKGGGE